MILGYPYIFGNTHFMGITLQSVFSDVKKTFRAEEAQEGDIVTVTLLPVALHAAVTSDENWDDVFIGFMLAGETT